MFAAVGRKTAIIPIDECKKGLHRKETDLFNGIAMAGEEQRRARDVDENQSPRGTVPTHSDENPDVSCLKSEYSSMFLPGCLPGFVVLSHLADVLVRVVFVDLEPPFKRHRSPFGVFHRVCPCRLGE